MQSFGPMVYALLDNGSMLTLERAFLRRHFPLLFIKGSIPIAMPRVLALGGGSETVRGALRAGPPWPQKAKPDSEAGLQGKTQNTWFYSPGGPGFLKLYNLFISRKACPQYP